jgi:hypothetical protein
MAILHRIGPTGRRIRSLIERCWSPLRYRKAAYPVAGLLLISLFAVFAACLEYRNDWIAGWVGIALDRTNARRARTGAVWKRLDARAVVKDTLRTIDAASVREALPDAVAGARFHLERVPETGMPSLIAVWRTELSTGASRDTRELIGSVGAFNQGLSLLKSAGLPEARYQILVQQRVDALYRHAGGTEWRARADSLEIADSIRADVRERLAGEIVEQLRSEERNRLIEDYRSGRVSQMLVQSGLGSYHGELAYVDPERTSVIFELHPAVIAELLGVGGGPP